MSLLLSPRAVQRPRLRVPSYPRQGPASDAHPRTRCEHWSSRPRLTRHEWTTLLQHFPAGPHAADAPAPADESHADHQPRGQAQRPRTADLISAALCYLGALTALVALILIWIARSTHEDPPYVSGLGAPGEPTEFVFRVALTMVGAAGILVGLGCWNSRAGKIAAAGALALTVAGLCFVGAAATPCTPGCPPPSSALFTAQDFAHLFLAITGFVLACAAMLLFAFRGRTWALLSCTAASLVAVIAGTGGILSLTDTATDFGALCEYVATSIGIAWLVATGVVSSIQLCWPRPTRYPQRLP